MSGRDARRSRLRTATLLQMAREGWGVKLLEAEEVGQLRYYEAMITGSVDLSLKTVAEVDAKIESYCAPWKEEAM